MGTSQSSHSHAITINLALRIIAGAREVRGLQRPGAGMHRMGTPTLWLQQGPERGLLHAGAPGSIPAGETVTLRRSSCLNGALLCVASTFLYGTTKQFRMLKIVE